MKPAIDIAPPSIDASRRSRAAIADYVALAKPRLNVLVIATSASAYYLAGESAPAAGALLQTGIGTALVAGGAAALNQLYERDIDAVMTRTRLRPLPDKRVSVDDARIFGVILASAGLLVLALAANLLASALALATLVTYVAVYTPLKRRSPSATLVGAVPGALPTLIGWTAGRGELSPGGWSLFAIVFLWQIPHFMAIAWLYRDDYRRAGLPLLPVLEPDGRRTGRQALLYAAALLPASLAPTLAGVAGTAYLWTALVLGSALLALSACFARTRSDNSARWLFYGSIIYLPLIWTAMILDH
jgi:protoheme IX farnesyltransferase